MPYNPLLGPDQCYGCDDGGYCEICGESIDGRCTCQLCDECRANIEEEDQFPITVAHKQTGAPVKIIVCAECMEKRDR